MSLRPMIVIGCGGSGGKTVQMLRHSLTRRLERTKWNGDFPAAWQLLYIDTPTTQEAPLAGVPPLPSSDYISLSEDFPKYDQLLNFLTTKADGHLDRLEGWLPAPPLSVPLREGAGQMRALGRAVGLTQYGSVAGLIKTALADAQRGVTELAQVSAVLEPNVQATPEDDQDPFVVVISSMAGGTGAGIFIDVCDVVRAVNPDLTNRILGVLFTAEVFRNLKNADGLQPNSLAVISELMSGQFEARPLEPTFAATGLASDAAVVAQSGPSYPFVVGMSTLTGKPLDLITDCYRSVSETLLSTMTSSKVSHSLTAYVAANWESEQQKNFPAWSFGRPTSHSLATGLVSSFGSAKLSLGLDRFSEYAQARLARLHFDFQRDEWQSYGRNRWGLDADSTAEQIESAWKANEGLAFVQRCQLRELNIGDDKFDEVIEVLASEEDQAQLRRTWRAEILSDLGGILKAEPDSTVWKKKIREDVARRTDRHEYANKLEQLISDGGATFRRQTPDRIVQEVSTAIAVYGLVPATGLIDYTIEHCEQAAAQLAQEARQHEEDAALWNDYYNNAFVDAPKKIDIAEPAGRGLAQQAIKAAVVYAMMNGKKRVAELGSEVLIELIQQILRPLKDALLQNREQVASADVSDWPGKLGVPDAFAPPPLERSLIPVDSWPELFVQKVSDAAAQDPGDQSWEAKVRGMIAGGGFTASITGGNVQPVPTALALATGSEWRPASLGGDRQKPIFVTSLTLEDIEDRALKWLLRDGTATEQLLNTDLRSFLDATDESNNPIVDHGDRMNRFETALAEVLQSAQPLIDMPTDVLQAVHPGVTDLASTILITEPLPIPDGHPARVRAEERVRSFLGNDATDEQVDEFFTNSGDGRESATFVSRLAGAVHPAAVSSLVTPISAKWRGGGADPATFWKNRRSRPLKESIPVHGPVRRAMIRGWYIGRFLGLIQNPTADDGFSIDTVSMQPKSSGDGGVATALGSETFPWPLLGGRIDTSKQSMTSWLPSLLESLTLAFALFPGDKTIIRGYEELYLLGQANRDLARAGQPMQYHGIGPELAHWLADGTASCFNVNPLDHADGVDERKAKAIECFKSYQQSVEKKMPSDLKFDPLHFWHEPFGLDLFPEIVDVLQSELIPAIQSWTKVDDTERG